MIPEYERMIGLRISRKDSEDIERLIKSKRYKSISHVARVALTEFLSKYREETAFQA
ncbi:MAG: hypothetical protein ABR909_13695 [Candidatus Bathyarchaeia archaeon]